jgi:hypothetical protein
VIVGPLRENGSEGRAQRRPLIPERIETTMTTPTTEPTQTQAAHTKLAPLRRVIKRVHQPTYAWDQKARKMIPGVMAPSIYCTETLECGHVLTDMATVAKRRRCAACLKGQNGDLP